ncbi:MAG: hypothetical protein WD154_00290 [Nitrosopumilaceae archaeon]
MSLIGHKSSTTILTLQTKNPTYTPEIFDRAIKELGYMASQANASISANPLAPPVPTIIYSKGNLMVLTNYGENLIRFIIINTLDINQLRSEINSVLEKLQVGANSIHITELVCRTEVPTSSSPVKTLTSLVNSNSLQKMSEILHVPKMEVLTMSFSNANWQNGEFRITIEPLASDPDNQFWLIIGYRTRSLLEFDKLVQTFNTQMVENIISTITPDTS